VFVAAVVLVHLLGRETALSAWGAGLYFSARLVYLPLYALGVPLLRSLVWNIAFAGIVLLLLASVWPDCSIWHTDPATATPALHPEPSSGAAVIERFGPGQENSAAQLLGR
jgi:hypothetical protein